MEYLFIRIAFLLISSFTFLNTVKIFNIPLHFPWLILFLISLIIWILWERNYKKRFDFPRAIGGLFLFQLYADTLLGNTFKFYAKFNWYDRFTHLTGGAVVGTLVFLILGHLCRKKQWRLTSKTLTIFTITVSLTIGIIWEFWEYFAYSFLGYKNLIIGETDTIDDLLFTFIGITIFIFLLSFIFKRKSYSLTN